MRTLRNLSDVNTGLNGVGVRMLTPAYPSVVAAAIA